MWCPMTKEECRTDCAWFRENRRKRPEGTDGSCVMVKIDRDLTSIDTRLIQIPGVISRIADNMEV